MAKIKKKKWLRYCFAGAAGALFLGQAQADPAPIESSEFSVEDLEVKEINIDLAPLLNKDHFTASDLEAATGKNVAFIRESDLSILYLEIKETSFFGSDGEKKQQLLNIIEANYADSNLEWYIMGGGDFDSIISMLETIHEQTEYNQFKTIHFPMAAPQGAESNPYLAMKNSYGSIITYNDVLFYSIDDFLTTSFGSEMAANMDLSDKDIDLTLLTRAVLIHEAEHMMQIDTIAKSMFIFDQMDHTLETTSYERFNKIVQSLEVDSDNAALTYLEEMNASTDTINFYKKWRALTGALSSVKQDHSDAGFSSHAVYHGLEAGTPHDAYAASESYDAFIQQLNTYTPESRRLTIDDLITGTRRMTKQEQLSPEFSHYAKTILEAADFMNFKVDQDPLPGGPRHWHKKRTFSRS